MTKEYVKPQIVFEEFSLSTNIAAGCEGRVDNPSKGVCAIIGTGGINMFVDTVEACDFTPPDEKHNGFCYHVPTEDKNLFNS